MVQKRWLRLRAVSSLQRRDDGITIELERSRECGGRVRDASELSGGEHEIIEAPLLLCYARRCDAPAGPPNKKRRAMPAVVNRSLEASEIGA